MASIVAPLGFCHAEYELMTQLSESGCHAASTLRIRRDFFQGALAIEKEPT